MRTKKHIQAANYYAFLGDVQRLAQKGTTWDRLPIRELHKRHHIGGWPKELLRGFDLKAPVSMDRACTLMAMACDYGRGMKATRDERGAHRLPVEVAQDIRATIQEGLPLADQPSRDELLAALDEYDRRTEVTAPDTDTLPFMTDAEMIAALRRHGYKIYKEVTL